MGRGCLDLRHITDPPGNFRSLHGGNLFSVEIDCAVPPLNDIGHAFEQSGLAGAVGSQNAEDITMPDGKGYITKYGVRFIATVTE